MGTPMLGPIKSAEFILFFSSLDISGAFEPLDEDFYDYANISYKYINLFYLNIVWFIMWDPVHPVNITHQWSFILVFMTWVGMVLAVSCPAVVLIYIFVAVLDCLNSDL